MTSHASLYIGYIGTDHELTKQVGDFPLPYKHTVKDLNGAGVALACAENARGICISVQGNDHVVIRDGEFVGADAQSKQIERAVRYAFDQEAYCCSAVSLSRTGTHIDVSLYADWSAIFPIYFTRNRNGILFSNQLRPIQELIKAEPDIVGISQFLTNGFYLSDRTCLSGVRRLLPGQVLSATTESPAVKIIETSTLWSSIDSVKTDDAAIIEEAAELLNCALRRSSSSIGSEALMMSGGWDSRTLMGAMSFFKSSPARCYFHGDIASREANIVRKLCLESRVPCSFESIRGESFSPKTLQSSFGMSGNVVFPHWHEAGHRLRELGVDMAVSGVYGEVFGGHYGESMLYDGLAKMVSVLRQLLGIPAESFRFGEPRLASHVLSKKLGKSFPWSMSSALRSELEEQSESDLRDCISRLSERGVEDNQILIEAFVSEHRGGQYISQQTLSLRSSIEVAVPFADRRFLKFSSRIPTERKVHNRLNRKLLQRVAPKLLEFPLAATIPTAARSILIQELGRVGRRIWESLHWEVHNRLNAVSAPRLGWANFESVRQDRVLSSVAETLRSSVWDHERIIKECEKYESATDTHSQPMVDMLMKIATIDLTIR